MWKKMTIEMNKYTIFHIYKKLPLLFNFVYITKNKKI